ncbi:MAG: MBL fold metallo-hydrolase [Actinomycetota bacterium]
MTVERLSASVRRVRAPNPSPITLEGTNTYIVGDAEPIVIDPGPNIASHLDEVLDAAGSPSLVLLTHRHADHAEGAERFAAAARAPLAAYAPPGGMHEDVDPVGDGQRITAAEVTLVASHTPGHSSDHLCFWLGGERALFTGDHVLGRGTTVIAYPDGDMAAYMTSLERAASFRPSRLYPGHGPVVDEPASVLRYYADHRTDRENQVLAAIDAGDDTVERMVARMYADVDAALHAAAALSLRAHLVKLQHEGRIEAEGNRWRRA